MAKKRFYSVYRVQLKDTMPSKIFFACMVPKELDDSILGGLRNTGRFESFMATYLKDNPVCIESARRCKVDGKKAHVLPVVLDAETVLKMMSVFNKNMEPALSVSKLEAHETSRQTPDTITKEYVEAQQWEKLD